MLTAEDLEKLAELKAKGIISEEEFNAKREEYLNQSTASGNKKGFAGSKFPFKTILAVLGVVAVLALGWYFIDSPQHQVASDSGNRVGKNGFTISISCQFNGNILPLQACTLKSEAVLETGADRRSYNGYGMPEIYDVPEHFSFYVYNGHDKFTIDVKVVDKATRRTISHRQVGPYDGDRIGN